MDAQTKTAVAVDTLRGRNVAAKRKGTKKANDACAKKVKSRYKVWPSAYASGAVAKCRKVGAKNWGNKSGRKKK